MKKINTFLCAVFCLGAVAAFCGCYDGGTFSSAVYECPAENVNRVNIDVSDREVEIVTSDGGVKIEYFESEKEYYDIALKDGTLNISLVLDKSWTDYIGGKPAAEYRKIVVRLPENAALALTVSTSNEKISASGGAETADFKSTGGDIVLNDFAVGEKLALSVKNANVTGSVAGSPAQFRIVCEIKKGTSNISDKADGDKALTVRCNNGDVNLSFSGV